MMDFSDGSLDAGRRARFEAHLAECEACVRLTQEMEATRLLLRALPAQRTSSEFELRLANRLAKTRQPREMDWRQRIWASLSPPPRLLRPALALGAAAAAVVGAILYPWQSPPPSPPVSTASESALVSQCVAQHQSDVAAQPLSDLAAQNLTAHLNDAVTTDPSADPVAEDNL